MSETSKLTASNVNISQKLVFGRLTAAERDSYFAANPPEIGLLIFNDDDKVLEMWNGTEWLLVLGDRTGGGGGVLYEFSSVTFNAGTSGPTGPNLTQVVSQIQGNDAWKSNTQYLDVANGIITWTVPERGDYKIECKGAQGGQSFGWGPQGGTGASASGTFKLRTNDKLKICVGQRGTGNYYDGGGGGGSFVTMADNSPLVCAGGGGGGSASGMNGPGPYDGSASEQGGSTAWFAGGTSGNGGGGGGAGGGGGLTGNGGGSYAGQSFTNGAVGGPNASGGFGGGGGGGGTSGAGGGGGYGGGGASYWSFFGSGGGSYVSSEGTNAQKQQGGTSGNGQVIITKV